MLEAVRGAKAWEGSEDLRVSHGCQDLGGVEGSWGESRVPRLGRGRRILE